MENFEQAYPTLSTLTMALKAHGVNSMITTSNPKVEKNAKAGIGGAALHLDPAYADWICPKAGLCRALCLKTAGNPGHLNTKEIARAARSALLDNDEQLFLFALVIQIAKWAKKQYSAGFEKLSFRPNATSDILFELSELYITAGMVPLLRRYGVRASEGMEVTIFELFPDIVFYDYTKVEKRILGRRPLPANYTLTFSLDGQNNVDSAIEVLLAGGNVAVPFYDIPEYLTLVHSTGFEYKFPVYNGDNSDFRPDDPPAHIIGLEYKIAYTADKKRILTNNGFILESDRIEQCRNPVFVRAAS